MLQSNSVRPSSSRKEKALLVWRDALLVLELGLGGVDRQRAPIPELVARDNEAPPVRRDALRVLERGLGVVERARGRTQHATLLHALLLDVAAQDAIWMLQSNSVRPTSRREEEALLVRRDALLVPDLGRDVVDRQHAPIPEQLAREKGALLVRRDALLLHALLLDVVVRGSFRML